MNGFEELIVNASIRIYQYGIDRRMEMEQINRVFPFYVMSYISEGHAVLKIGERKYELGPGSVIIVPPYVQHDHLMTRNELTVFWWWHFDYRIYDTIDLLKLLRLPLVYMLKNSEKFETLFNQYNEAMTLSASLNNTLHKRACILEVMGHLLGEAERENLTQNVHSEIPPAFREMLETIVTGDINNLTLKFFSEKYNMHPTYISNRFAEYFGIPPIRLHRKLQLERAMKVLSSSGKSVGEVAEMFGFSDVSTFSRLFAANMGIAPSKVAKHDAAVFKSELF